jgi:hypothetical protein
VQNLLRQILSQPFSGRFMRKLVFSLLLANAGAIGLVAQSAMQLQHPGSICCDQVICPGDAISQITQDVPTTPAPPQVNVEYAWYELVDDSTTSSGTRWYKIPNTNQLNFQPTQINSQFGGFYMRGVRITGTLPYLFSNIVNIKELSPSNPTCLSSSGEAPAGSQITISPNPAESFLYISSINEVIPIHGYRVVGLGGATMLSAVVEPVTQLQLDIQSLPSGLYFVELILKDGKTSVHKWVKV